MFVHREFISSDKHFPFPVCNEIGGITRDFNSGNRRNRFLDPIFHIKRDLTSNFLLKLTELYLRKILQRVFSLTSKIRSVHLEFPINFFVVFHERERRGERRRRRPAWPSSRGNVLPIRKRKLKRRREKGREKKGEYCSNNKIRRRERLSISLDARDEQSRTWTSFEYELRQLASPLFPARLFVRWLARIAGHCTL